MSNPILAALVENFDRVHNLTLHFIDTCPDALWGQKSCGWPVWQHIAHTYGCIDHFVLQEGDTPTPALCSRDVIMFNTTPQEPLSKSEIKVYALAKKAQADAYIARLSDAALPKRNQGLSTRKNEDISHAGTLSRLSGHGFYHLAPCDGILRQNGLPGIY